VFRKLRPTGFEPIACGRAMIYSALDALLEQTASVRPAARLPEGLPFGDVCIDSKACTLCMACVAACPTEALRDGGNVPQIRFQEESCVQCGLCQTACPEKAIRLVPRMVFDRQARRAVRCLNQAEPVGCVVCGRPFAVAAMVDRVAQRLANHWMYQSDAAKRRLRMCSDCRVQDFIRENGRPDQKTPSPDEH
jgi:ferredoxin